MPAGRDVAARPGIDLGDLAGGEDLLFLDDHRAAAVAALRIGPDARRDIAHAVDDIRRPVIAYLALRALGGDAADRLRRVDQEVEPVGAVLDIGAALGPDHPVIGVVGGQRLHVVGRLGERRPGRRRGQVIGLVGEEVLAPPLGRNGAVADIRPLGRREAAPVAAGGNAAVEVDIRQRGDRTRDAGVVDHQPVDLLEAARPVRVEPLARLTVRRAGGRAFLLPGRAVRLPRHVGQRVKPVLRQHLDLVDRLVVGRPAFDTEGSVGADIAVRPGVERGRVSFQRMGRKLLHIDPGRCGQPLPAERVVGQGASVRSGQERQPVFPARLVRGHQRRGVLDRRRRPRQMRDAHFAGHDFPPCGRFAKVYLASERRRNRAAGKAALSAGNRVATVISRQSGRRSARCLTAGEPEGRP